MFSFSTALWLAAAAVLTTEVSAAYNPVSVCYSSGLLINCGYKVTCEGFFSHIQCDPNQVIRIHDVDYGRHDDITCAGGRSQSQIHNVYCSTPGAKYKVAQMCNGRRSCVIRASNSMFGEPCAGTSKYLQVSYFCEPRAVICEGRTANLQCAPGKTIRIHGVDYGRRYSDICAAGRPPRQLQNVQCIASTPTHNVTRACNGNNRCAITASNEWFGDPCPDTYKYLHLSFFCICFKTAGGSVVGTVRMISFRSALCLFATALVVTYGQMFPSQFSVVTCGRGGAHILACKSGLIDVVASRYGPKEGTCCSVGCTKDSPNPLCTRMSSTEGLQERCDGKRVCEVHTGPCDGPCYVDYLQTWYNCSPIVLNLTVCEQGNVGIDCEGKSIEIVEAFYGRQDNTTCSNGRNAAEVENTNCNVTDVLNRVNNHCQGHQNCSFTANAGFFPDECPVTYKYLSLLYYCKAP